MMLSWRLPIRLQVTVPVVVQRVADALIPIGFALWVVKPVGDLWLVFLGYVLILAGSLVTAMRSGAWIEKRILYSFLASILVGVVGGVVGLQNGNPGAPSEIVFFVLLPLTWFVFTACLDGAALRRMIDTLPLVALLVGLFGVLFWMDASGRANLPWINAVDLGQGLGSEVFGYEMRYYPISSMVFLLPFLFMSLVIPSTYSRSASRLVAPFALLTCLTLLFIAGRRALFVALVFALAVVFVLFMLRRGVTDLRNRMFVVGGATAAASLLIAKWTEFSFLRLTSSITSGVSSVPDETTVTGQGVTSQAVTGQAATGQAVNDQVRTDSADALIASWKSSPIFGHGFGDTISGPPRNVERPWEFELQYHLLLNAVGIVGLLVLVGITMALLIRTVLVIRRRMNTYGYFIPVLAGSLAILVANASNPYLHTPGHYWMFFLTVIAANVAFSRKGGAVLVEPASSRERSYDVAAGSREP